MYKAFASEQILKQQAKNGMPNEVQLSLSQIESQLKLGARASMTNITIRYCAV